MRCTIGFRCWFLHSEIIAKEAFKNRFMQQSPIKLFFSCKKKDKIYYISSIYLKNDKSYCEVNNNNQMIVMKKEPA